MHIYYVEGTVLLFNVVICTLALLFYRWDQVSLSYMANIKTQDDSKVTFLYHTNSNICWNTHILYIEMYVCICIYTYTCKYICLYIHTQKIRSNYKFNFYLQKFRWRLLRFIFKKIFTLEYFLLISKLILHDDFFI